MIHRNRSSDRRRCDRGDQNRHVQAALIKERIAENLESANVELTEEEFAALEGSLNGLKVYGHRGLGGF